MMLAALLLLAQAGALHAAEDWPFARGNALGTGVAQSVLTDAPEQLWTYAAGNDASFEATAVIENGVIYVGDTAGKLHAVRLADGKAVWAKEFADSSFISAAAVDGDRLYVGEMSGVVRCVSTADGAEQWQQKLDGEIYAGPMLHGDDVLVTTEAGTLYCLDKNDGKQRWEPFRIDAPLRCTPTVASGRVMLSGCDSLLHIINIADGKQLETVEIDGPTGSTPALLNERVFFGTEGGTFFAIDAPAGGESKSSVAWTYRDPRRGQPIRTAAAVTDEVVIFGSQGKAIYALDPESGKPKWPASPLATRARVESSPVIAGKRVVAATTAGKLYLLDVANGDVKWEHDAGGGFIASPAVVDGRMVIGSTDGTLYCFGRKGINHGGTESTEKKEEGKK